MRSTLAALCLGTLFVFAADPEPEPAGKPREVAVTKAPGGFARMTSAAKYTSAAELTKAFSKELAEEIAKTVNFKNEYVVVQQWAGSGGDKMTLKLDGKKVSFDTKRGLTRDLRSHFKVFAVPNGYTVDLPKMGVKDAPAPKDKFGR